AGKAAGRLGVADASAGAIRARYRAADAAQRGTGEDAALEPHRAREPERRPGDALHRGLVGERYRLTAEGCAQLRLRDLVVAAHQHHHRVAAGTLVDQGLDEALRRHAEERAHLGDAALARSRD